MSSRAAAALAFAAVVVAVLPLAIVGFPKGHDAGFELVRMAEFGHAVAAGQLIPFWAPNLYGGHGSPIFIYYAPLFDATTTALRLITGSVPSAAAGALMAFTLLGAVLMWRFVREVRPAVPAAATIAVALFVLHPYLLADKWIRNANAEFAALCVLPAILHGATTARPRRAFWLTAISLAALVLIHNLTALVATVLALGISAVVHRRAAAPVWLGAAAGIGLSAFFWYPAFALQPLMRTEELLLGKFDFHRQFPALGSLFGIGMFYAAGPVTALLLVILPFARSRDAHVQRVIRACAIAAWSCFFFVLPLSTFLWETLPLLRFAQFPWRFVGPIALLTAAAAGIACAELSWIRAAIAIAFAAALLNAAPMLRAAKPLKIVPPLTPQAIQKLWLRAAVLDADLPRDVVRRAPTPPPPGTRMFPRWAYPVWSATAGGEPVAIGSHEGRVTVRPPRPNAQIVLTLTEPPVRLYARAFSALLLVALLAGDLVLRRRRAISS